MYRNFKYRLYPTRLQSSTLDRVFELHRQLYNAALEQRREAYRKRKKSLSYYAQASQLKDLRHQDPDIAWLNYSSCQQTLRRLDKAFNGFFRRMAARQKAGYPRFKSSQRFNLIEFPWRDGARLKGNRLYVQNVGDIKVKWHRQIPAEALIKRVYLRRDKDEWYAIFMLELPDPEPVIHTGPVVGIDLGLNSLLAQSDGKIVQNPRWYRSTEEKLAREQRTLSRRKQFSKRRQVAARRVAKLHRKIANQRLDFHHKLSHRLANTYSLIAIENLNLLGLGRSHLAKSVCDAGWGRLIYLLTYKVENTGSQLVVIAPHYTSQICSGCGSIVPKDLSTRVHNCPNCGLELDRDVNAARNILRRAIYHVAWTEPAVNSPSLDGCSREAACLYIAESSPPAS